VVFAKLAILALPSTEKARRSVGLNNRQVTSASKQAAVII